MKIVVTRAQSASSLERPRVDIKSAPVKSASLKLDTRLLSTSRGDWSRPQSESSALRPRAGQGRVPAWSLSEAAREENSRKELISYQLDNVRSHPSSPAAHCIAEINDDPEVVGVEKPEVFLKNASELDHAIEAMTKRVRLDHLMGSLESAESMKMQQIREEARKRKEAEIRKARKKAQESSNPNTKVEARMSLARISTAPDLSVSSKKGSVPMQTLSVDRAGGRVERVTVVDIRMLQQNCLCLDNNHDVHAILEVQKRREKQGSHSSSCSLQRSNSAPVRGLRGLTSQEKHDLVYSKGQKMQAQLTLQRVSNMRNQWKFDLPFVIDREILADNFTLKVKEAPAAAGDDSPFFPKDETLECSPSGSRRGARRRESLSKSLPVNVLLSPQLPLHGREEADISSSPSRRRVSITGAISPAASPARRNGAGSMSLSPMSTGLRGSSPKRRMTIATLSPTKSAASILSRKLWSYSASALVKVLMLLFRVRKRHRSVAVMQFFLKHFGEWARMRRSITQLRNSTKVLQRTFRSFHASKKRRCAAMEKEWIRVEDHLLSTCFTNLARKLMSPDDSKGQQGRRPQRASKSKSDQRSGEAPEVMIDWKIFRIPQRERKAIISIFFMLGLRKRTRMQQNFYNLTVEALSSQRDLQRYLKSFGCTSEEAERLKSEEHDSSLEATKEPSTESKVIPFYVLCEDTAHFMIHQAAQALVNVDPFQEHPHNKDNPNKKIRPPGSVMVFAAAEDSDGKISADLHPHSIADLALNHQERRMFRKPEKDQRPSSSQERHTSKPKQDTVSQGSKSSHRARHRDVEEVLGNFVFHSEGVDELSEDEGHSHALSAAS